MNCKKVMIRTLLAGLLVSNLFIPAVKGNNVKAELDTSETREATYPLARDEKGSFLMTGGVLASSKHNVEFYYGGSASTWNNNDVEKYALTKAKCVVYKAGQYRSVTITPSMCSYDFVKVCMYGNKKTDQKKKCYANGILANYKG